MLTSKDLINLYPALVTPFTDDDKVDTAALTHLVGRMFDGGAQGVVPLGGTAEYTALSPAERRAVVECTVAASKGRGPVVAGVLSPGYAEAKAEGLAYKAAGADAIMLLTPFYAMGDQPGIAAYIRRFRAEVDLPIVLYEIPARTNISLAPETIAALAEDGTAIGIKFSNYDVPRFARIAGMVGDDFAMMSGEEPLVATHIQLGACGAVLATANLFPRYWSHLFELAAKDSAAAIRHQLAFQPVLDAVFAEANPGPLKGAMEIIGQPVGTARLPLVPPSPQTERLLRDALSLFQPEWGDAQQ
ncbi:dihydrodipicolinate synthase family protein [Aquicoccus porphyridii]|uniref:Dihydrodipicolinate synthase family protein n=1 Tax=Aquicoccus porphyridii TaxID=1852029 RepID=A0A5A9ZKF9_9RHOB|nr:dihydrodipicolinate synthase family protein [Aquicoccus porphyridii]KAA0917512.1 dihydrodipicolinate synthase family protein [Aquicoccus porphyridii]RAI55594.1 4-hydroxy-tetrahydrodipicolinate synthase [Rhodobacteraceae bacterium AsT-22]